MRKYRHGYGHRRTFRPPTIEETSEFVLAEAIKMHDGGFSYRKIARYYGITHPTVRLKILAHRAAMAKMVALASITSNIRELDDRLRARHGGRFPLDLSRVFIVRPEHVQYGLGSEQPVVGFECWRPEYRTLDIFQPPTKFYVLVVAQDGVQINRAWLDSIAADVWLRERCAVAQIVKGTLAVFQSRYNACLRYPAQLASLADETFEREYRFELLP